MVPYRLHNYPGTPNYQTQVIDYPGGVYSGQNMAYAPLSNAHTKHHQPVHVHTNPQYRAGNTNAVPAAVTTTAEPSTTTTQLPSTIETLRHEEVNVPIPDVHAPVHHRRIGVG